MRHHRPRARRPLPPVPRLRRPSAFAALGAAVAAGVALLVLGGGGALAHSGAATAEGTHGDGYHVVRSGDTVHAIARLHGVSPDDVRAANGIVDDRLYAGARLRIVPGAAGSSGSSGGGGTHVVEPGDVPIHIARDHGVALDDLLALNGLTMTSLIMPGDVLRIPGGSGSWAGAVGTWPRVVCPVPGASYMNSWGFPRGTSRFHQGTDLFAPRGTTIRAPVTGQLTFSENRLGGLTFTIETPSGWVAYGAHLSDTIGDSRWVAAGDPIGRVGDSGNARGGDPHLHLELDRGAGAVNPYPSLLAAC
ncbi:MAG TPA: LysM peptidoglycan-binding domain-containing M23 family metallopeptidase [Microthrixaceae bacterium]|nr:LysM peptidoglycan-binding domain-containing M23 family metallopeptidase [Microthrixaceae bacterium]